MNRKLQPIRLWGPARLPIRGEYPRNWPQIARRVKARAGWRCVRCSHPDERPGKPVPCDALCSHTLNGKQRMLTVHHMDGDKENCQWWNLLALCQVCHLSLQAMVNPFRPFAGKHSAWLRPYVAGFYAWHYPGKKYSRPYVEKNLERLLELGRSRAVQEGALAQLVLA